MRTRTSERERKFMGEILIEQQHCTSYVCEWNRKSCKLYCCNDETVICNDDDENSIFLLLDAFERRNSLSMKIDNRLCERVSKRQWLLATKFHFIAILCKLNFRRWINEIFRWGEIVYQLPIHNRIILRHEICQVNDIFIFFHLRRRYSCKIPISHEICRLQTPIVQSRKERERNQCENNSTIYHNFQYDALHCIINLCCFYSSLSSLFSNSSICIGSEFLQTHVKKKYWLKIFSYEINLIIFLQWI